MKKLSILFFILLFSTVVFGQTNYDTYGNARFGYSISYPSNLIPQGESENGDGQAFETKDKSAKLTVWGSHNALDQSLKEKYKGFLK
jgi:hypothetical protein